MLIRRAALASLVLSLAAPLRFVSSSDVAAAPAETTAEVTPISLPGASPDGVGLDYIAIDRARNRVWVPAGGTGRVDVIDTKTLEVHAIEKFPTAEIEREGKKRTIGPSSASVGDGFVYVGNRADSSVCAVDASTLMLSGCAKIPSSPDGVVYVASAHQVWVTAPRDKTIFMLDVSTPGAPKMTGNFTVEGVPEGYAVDDRRGVFYTNLEDKDRTLKIDVKSHKVLATWMPACGQDGPRGLAVEPAEQLLVVACTDHIEVLDAGKDGQILSKLDTGAGVDNLDYLARTRSVYAAAGRAPKITVAHLDAKGILTQTASQATAKGARNAVVSEEGVAFVADGPEGKVLVVKAGVQ
jgi:DNA-binding beta-propeller fold protein YncE